MNIPETLTKLLSSGESLGSLSSMLGLGREETSKAVATTVPTLLAAFTQVASSSKGAQMLANAASEQDPSHFNNISQTVAAKGSQITQQGSNLLSSILGSTQSSALGGILSRFCGVGEGSIGKILGLLSPMILGFLGRQSGGGATGIASLLNGQKDYIRNAMPAGLVSMLSSALPGFGDMFTKKDAQEPAYATREVYDTQARSEYPSRPVETASPLRWAVPALAAIALIGLLSMWARRGRVQEEPTTATVVRTTNFQRNAPIAVGSPAQSTIGTASSSSFVSDTSKLITDATKTLSEIRDGPSADAAIEKIKEINSRLDSSKSTWSSLPEGTRTLAQSSFSPLITKLESTSESALNMPGVGDTVRPYVNELIKKLKAFTQTTAVTPPAPAP